MQDNWITLELGSVSQGKWQNQKKKIILGEKLEKLIIFNALVFLILEIHVSQPGLYYADFE